MKKICRRCVLAILVATIGAASQLAAQEKRKVVIDQDCPGPGGTDMQSIIALINSEQTAVLGITVVTGDAWRDEEVQHTLRLLEIIERTDIPVLPGAVFPLVNTKEATARWEKMYGRVIYQGAWNRGKPVHGPYEVPPLPEGAPSTKPASEDAAHFLIRTVRAYPHQVTIYAGGPLTNLALAQAIDPEFAALAKELVWMGGSIHPTTDDPEFSVTPRREFNVWMDPEAAHVVLHAPWKLITVTTVDISVRTRMDKDMIAQIAKSTTPAAQYVAKYAREGYLWDELAAVAWLDPSIIKVTASFYFDVSLDRGASYGDTLVWKPRSQPGVGEPQVVLQENLDRAAFYKEFVELMTRPTPGAKK
jgi:inosine-uridine nucleoside N-ribohydrolase